MTTAEALAILRQARDAFKAAGKRSLVLACNEVIEEAREEIKADERFMKAEAKLIMEMIPKIYDRPGRVARKMEVH